MVRGNKDLLQKYHPCAWMDGVWLCCHQEVKQAMGCKVLDSKNGESDTWITNGRVVFSLALNDVISRIYLELPPKGIQEAPSSDPDRGRNAPHIPDSVGLKTPPPSLFPLGFQEKPAWTLAPQPPEPQGPTVGMTVTAEYNFSPTMPQDLELKKDEQYTIVEMSDPNWWKARDKYG